MATQIITLAVLGGQSAVHALSLFRRWSAQAIQHTDEDNDTTFEWSIDLQQQADHFVEQLLTHRHEPQVLYFSSWLDYWSMGDLFMQLTVTDQPCEPTIESSRYQIYHYSFPDKNHLREKFQRIRKPRYQEHGWFAWHVRQAANSWEHLTDQALLIVARQPIGCMRDDYETKAALPLLPVWLAQIIDPMRYC